MFTRKMIVGMIVMFLAMMSTTAWGTTYYVDPNGSDDANGSPEEPFATIQKGIVASSNGDTVIVGDGVYTGYWNRHIQFLGKEVTVRSANGPENCIIDVEWAAGMYGFYIIGGEDSNSVLDGITIIKGSVGIVFGSGSSPLIKNCIIKDCGKGMHCWDSSSPIISGCVISDNAGDGIAWYGTSMTVSRCILSGNGNGVYGVSVSDANITNCMIVKNDNGIYLNSSDSLIASNCTIAENGYGLRCLNSDIEADVNHCILWDNTVEIYVEHNEADITVTYCDVKDGLERVDVCEGTLTWSNNIDADPLFADAEDDDFHLQQFSPCVDAGDPNYDPNTTDVDGQPRKNNIVDIGADEAGVVWYVDVDAIGLETGLSWEDAFTNIQDGIDAASAAHDDLIAVAEGTYSESIDFDGKPITVKKVKHNEVADAVINPGDTDVNVVTFDSGEDAQSVLHGFVLTGGKNGVYCDNSSSPVIRNCIITDNNSVGIACISGSPLITNNKIGENGVDGIYSSSSTPPTIKYSWIYKNENGIRLTDANSAAWITNNTIADNNSVGIYRVSGTEPNVNSCILWGNDGNDLIDCNNVRYSCVQECADPNYYNISVDPIFFSSDSNDYSLKPYSPCVDLGDPNVDRSGDSDIDGHSIDQVTPDQGGDEREVYYVNLDVAYLPGNVTEAGKWATPFKYLQSALRAIDFHLKDKPNYIYVAGGPVDDTEVEFVTYYPTQYVDYESAPGRVLNSNDEGETFRLVEGVKILGGFNFEAWDSDEDPWDEDDRDPIKYKTILSGQIIDNRRSYHVVTADDPGIDELTVLDGFIIEKGYAKGGGEENHGGGMYIQNCEPMVKNCIFRYNLANANGGGMAIRLETYGGSWPRTDYQPQLINCTFIYNWAGYYAGGMENYCIGPILTNCGFIYNTTSGRGGGMWNYFCTSDPDWDYTAPTLTNCVFSGNWALWDASTHSSGGGGIQNFHSDPTLINCTFSKNYANFGYGGGIYTRDDSVVEITNCIFWGNQDKDGTDESAQIHDDSSEAATVIYSCIQDETPDDDHYPGEGNIDDAPLFVNSNYDVRGPDGIFRTYDDGLQLGSDSPCIDTANDGLAPDFDILNQGRYVADRGAYDEEERIHFSGGLIAHNTDGPWGSWYSVAFINDYVSDILPRGDYPDAQAALYHVLNFGMLSFDGMIIPPTLKIIIYPQQDFLGIPLLEEAGPLVIYNFPWRSEAGAYKFYEDWSVPRQTLQNVFPQSVRTWSETQMGGLVFGSFKILPNE